MLTLIYTLLQAICQNYHLSTYQLMVPVASSPDKLFLTVTFCIHLSLQIWSGGLPPRSQFYDESKKNHFVVQYFVVVIVGCYCCSVTKSCPTLCNPVDFSTPGLPVLHNLLEFAQVHVLELVMLFHHLILCSPLLLLPSVFPRIRAFFQRVGSSHQMAKVLELQL